MQANKILKLIFILLIVITLAELTYYLWYNVFSINKKTNTTNEKINVTVSPNIKDVQPISEENMNFINDPYYGNMLPLKYDETRKLLYINFRPNDYLDSKRNMGIDYGAWISLSSPRKGQVDYYIAEGQIHGIISDIKITDTSSGKQINLWLKDDYGNEKLFIYNNFFINKSKIVKKIKDTEIPMDWEKELKIGDKLTILEKNDLTKPPKDPGYVIEGKITKI